MANRITSVERLDTNGTWRYVWGGTAPYRLYRYGRLLADDTLDGTIIDEATTNNTSRVFDDGDAYEPPQLEVLDSTDSQTPDNILYPAYLALQWHEAPEAHQYRVDRYIGAAWVAQQYVPADDRGYYVYETPPLTDGETYIYRIVPLTETGDELQSVTYTVDFVTIPEPPEVSITLATGTVTVAAR